MGNNPLKNKILLEKTICGTRLLYIDFF